MRYVVSLIAASLMIAAAAAFCAGTKSELLDHVRQQLRKSSENDPRAGEWLKMLDQGTLPPEFGIEVPGSLMWKITVSDLLMNLRYVGIIIAVGLCLAAAYFIPGSIHQGRDLQPAGHDEPREPAI